MFKTVLTLLLFIASISNNNAYRILGIFPLNSRSHEMMFESLMVGLAKRGHQVDVITNFPAKNPPKNYKVILNLAGTTPNLVNNFTMEFALSASKVVTETVADMFGNRLCDLMGLKEIQDIIHNPPKDPPYDIYISESFGTNCFLGIGHHLKVPIVAASSAVEYPWVSDFTGNDDNPAVVPNALFNAFGEMSFWQRLQNTFIYHTEKWTFQKMTEHAQTELMRKYIDPNMPNIREIEKSVALTLVNSHPILFGVKPVLPTLVQVAGMHVEGKEVKLPLGLQNWMDSSKDGVLYFTFGSMILVETLPQETLKMLYASFAKLAPVRVLIKIANESKLPPGLPDNILTLPWIPQQGVLAHNNTRAFMTHGGLMGSQEALYFGVPMIGVPLIADQPRNVEAFAAKNMTIKLELQDFTEERLDAALNSILYDQKYRKYAKYYSKLFRDKPMSAVDTADYWIKYVIRNGVKELRSPALNLAWWQLASLDIHGFVLLVLVFASFALYKVTMLLVNTLNPPTANVPLDKKVK